MLTYTYALTHTHTHTRIHVMPRRWAAFILFTSRSTHQTYSDGTLRVSFACVVWVLHSQHVCGVRGVCSNRSVWLKGSEMHDEFVCGELVAYMQLEPQGCPQPPMAVCCTIRRSPLLYNLPWISALPLASPSPPLSTPETSVLTTIQSTASTIWPSRTSVRTRLLHSRSKSSFTRASLARYATLPLLKRELKLAQHIHTYIYIHHTHHTHTHTHIYIHVQVFLTYL